MGRDGFEDRLLSARSERNSCTLLKLATGRGIGELAEFRA
jgi:hypothetical protein